MSERPQNHSQDDLISALAGTLTPVRPLAPPLVRTLVWSVFVIALGVIAAPFANLPALQHRLMATPDLWLAAAASALTAFAAALAAFELSLPDRSARWAILPAPFALVWIAASGAGCLRALPIGGVRDPTMSDERDCLLIILAFSIPLGLLLLVMLRRGYSLRPELTASIAGVAVAASAATLLMFFHPFDATLSDLIAHCIGVAIVIAAIRWFGAYDLRENPARGA